MSVKAVKNGGILHAGDGRAGFTLMILLLLCHVPLFAGYTVRYEPSPGESKVRIDGTSNLHDWSIEGTVIQGYVDVNETCRLNPKVQELSGLEEVMASVKTHVEIPIRSLKSGHSGMDRNTYEALRRQQYPRIIYNLEQISVTTRPEPPYLTAQVNTTGRLSIAGVTRTLNMPVTVKSLADQQFEISGAVNVEMTDFDVTPPTAFFGMLRTGDQVTIHFTWTLERQTPLPHMPRYVAPAEHRQAITEMVLSYLQAADALAGKQLSRAKEALAGVEKATEKLAQLQTGPLPEDGQKAWQEDIERLRAASASVMKEEDLEHIRLAFRELSRCAIALVSDFGYMSLKSERPLFGYCCSCDEEQAKQKTWLQNTATADSPYEPTVRGHLSCGSPTAIYCPQRSPGQDRQEPGEPRVTSLVD